MSNDRPDRIAPTPPEEPAIDPQAAERAIESGSFDTTGYGEDYAAVEADSSLEEVERAWEAAEEDVDEADLRLMDPGERLEPGREPREGDKDPSGSSGPRTAANRLLP